MRKHGKAMSRYVKQLSHEVMLVRGMKGSRFARSHQKPLVVRA